MALLQSVYVYEQQDTLEMQTSSCTLHTQSLSPTWKHLHILQSFYCEIYGFPSGENLDCGLLGYDAV
jgi:hypothetical protein